MTGYVRSKGLPLSGKQVAKSLRRVNPADHARRREDTVRRRNPVPHTIMHFTMETSYIATKMKNWGCMDVRFMHLAMAVAQESSNCFPCLEKMQSLYMHISGLSNNQEYGITFTFYVCKT